MRTAFPYRLVKEFINDFEMGFLALASVVLVLFSAMTWFVIHYQTTPIQNIISAVAKYKEGELNPLGELRRLFRKVDKSEDVGKLAETLISLSERVEKQIFTLLEERNEKEVLLESLVEGVIATDRDLTITFANLAALKFFDSQKESLIGLSFKSSGQDQAYQMLLTCQKEERPVTDTLRMHTQNHDYFLETIAVPKKDNTGAILVMQYKSYHYRILEMRKDFIANASHELKTPITIIRGFAETLYDHPDLKKEITQEITGKIVKNCERMATLVRDLLALQQISKMFQVHAFVKSI